MRRFLLLWICLAAPAFTLAAQADDIPLPDGLYAEFVMPRGTVTCELFATKTPLTVTSFVGLAEGSLAPRNGRPFFTGLTWYRVVPGFVIQSGNPGLADTGDEPKPYKFPDEFVPGLHHDAAGVLSMANAGPDTNGCEFFLTLAPTVRLNYLHAVFGRVVRGLELLQKIQQGDAITAVRIRRVGAAAQAFRADEKTFAALAASLKPYAGAALPGPAAPFDDPDHLLPAEPPRAKNFNLKLANFERATGIKVFARVFAHYTPQTPAQRPGNYAGTLARSLGLATDGVLAVYFADTQQWGLWIGDAHVNRFMGRPGTIAELTKGGAFHEAKQALLAAAKLQAERYTAEATQAAPPDKPVTPAQKTKYAVDAVLDALLLQLEPR